MAISARAYPSFLSMMHLGVSPLSLPPPPHPPGWHASPFQGYAPAFHQTSQTTCQYSFILSGGDRHYEREVFFPRTQQIHIYQQLGFVTSSHNLQ